MKNHKAPGENNILAKMIKGGGSEALIKLADIFNTCLTADKISDNWNIGVVIILHRKGNKTNLDNYRPISSLSHVFKLFTKILTNRLVNKLGSNQPTEQAIFRRDYGIWKHINNEGTFGKSNRV